MLLVLLLIIFRAHGFANTSNVTNRIHICGGTRVTVPWVPLRPLARSAVLMRMRKAGSSTLCNVLRGWVKIDVVVAEQFALNMNCLPLASRAVLVTHLREPLGRHESEYWYKGAGSKSHENSAERWRRWMLPSLRGCKFGAGGYIPNYYTRRLTARCGACDGSSLSCDRSAETMEAGACAHRRRLGPNDARQAIDILAKFDVVYILELAEQSARALAAALGLEEADREPFARAMVRTRITHGSQNTKPTNATIPPDVRLKLQHENVWDIQLYDAARRRYAA
ncbi:hypothetical protein CTAYLR_008895 [Chrysophaeum taylorii]|uniref:Sulfotransferase n=1 Tax=Chrysophaeum taylorii TaxID=2483200 RepID=A0AAD7UJQ3_9STRA|nr:hypothetical protein CTAYLR_008895 [Chrysophaeum taylorii]